MAVLQGKNTKFRAAYVGLNGRSRGRLGGEEVDISLDQKTNR